MKNTRNVAGFFTNVYVGEAYGIFRKACALKEASDGFCSDGIIATGKIMSREVSWWEKR